MRAETAPLSVLIVAYYFPPHGGAGTQRFAKFVQYLPEFGVTPIVVTSDARDTNPNAPVRDDAIQVPPGTKVIRVAGESTPRTLMQRIRRRARLIADYDEWVALAWPVVEAAIEEHRPDAVITTLSPYAASDLGIRVQRRFRLPWIVDLRDPWALDGWRVYPTYIHALFDLNRMRRTLSLADIVVANTPASRREYENLVPAARGKTWTISNGFDPADFSGGTQSGDRETFSSRSCEEGGDVFRLAHIGTLHNVDEPRPTFFERCRQKSWRRVEYSARSGRHLFEAVARLKRSAPDLFAHLRLELVGIVHPSHRRLAARLDISDHVFEHGYQRHRDSLKILERSSAVFLPLHAIPDGEEALIVPGKTYEALASGKHIIAAFPDGDGKRLIEMSGAGRVCSPTSASGLYEALREAIALWRDGSPCLGARRADLEPFTRRSLTRRLAAAIGFVTGRRHEALLDDPWKELERRIEERGSAVS